MQHVPEISAPELVAKIHARPVPIVLAVAGGGSRAIAELLEVPGSSRTVLEAVVPYSPNAMAGWLGSRPDQFCSAATARAMAVRAFIRARELLGNTSRTGAGIACTASLATDRVKRGSQRAHVAAQMLERTVTDSIEFFASQRTRRDEEGVLTAMLLNIVAECCALEERLPLGLLVEEEVVRTVTEAPSEWQALLMGSIDAERHGSAGTAGQASSGTQSTSQTGAAIFPGAFNPLHDGHRRMAEVAEQILGVPVAFEISIINVEKPPLDYTAMEERQMQFGAERTLWFTRAPTFDDKSRTFPGATFIVGADTLARIADECYYEHSADRRDAAIARLRERGCKFLVFGRTLEGTFQRLQDFNIPTPLRAICQEVPASEFREDVSSTELRRAIVEDEPLS